MVIERHIQEFRQGERRKWPRLPANNEEVSISLLGARNTNVAKERALALNASDHGLCLAVDVPLRKAEYLKITIPYPMGGGIHISTLAEIRWVKRDGVGENKSGKYKVGVHYILGS